MSAWRASEVLRAIRQHHHAAAIVPECVTFDVDATENTYRRIDALMFRTRVRTAIEIKVSVADFRRESDAKRDPWRRIVHRFVYAAPQGLLNPSDIPDGCGLWEVTEHGRVLVTKNARLNKAPDPLPDLLVQALAYRAMQNGRVAA